MTITEKTMADFRAHLLCREKSPVTVEKYLRDASAFARYANRADITKALVIGYKNDLIARGYAVRSVNSMLAGVNSLLSFLGLNDCRVKGLRCQRRIYTPEERELTKGEYLRLLRAAEAGKPRLSLILKTICGTGIRVSELQYFTLEAARQGEVTIHCKSKTRTILLPGKLRKQLLSFAKQQHITAGALFVTRTGKPLDRSTVWAEMKGLCAAAGVAAKKVFPHNLRKLFARTFYALEKDIAKLADLLGHSSINTTRIYIMTTGREHRRQIERLGLVV